MGVLAAVIPSGYMDSIQESAFDLAYLDDTSQSEAEGLFHDVGAPISESDAFKVWGKSFAEGLTDCLKADFAFDWSKSPEDCVDALHPTFNMYNATNLDSWSSTVPLEVQEVGFLVVAKDPQKIEADTSYWDEVGKARFRFHETYSNSNKCDSLCEEFSPSNDVMFLNFWYGVFAMAGLSDGWTVAHAMAANPPTDPAQSTLISYLEATEAVPMDPSTSGLPVATKTFLRLYHFTLFLYTPDSPTLGEVPLKPGEYGSLQSYLLSEGKKFHEDNAATYGVPKRVSPLLQKVAANSILGWGEMPYWIDPISSAVFTFNFIGGASENILFKGGVPSAFMEEQMSSAFYHEGLGYVTQHYETFSGSTTYNHSCAWDPDCAAVGCFPTDTCAPLAAAGYDGLKIPGTYFGSGKGAPGFPVFENFVLTYYLVLTIKAAGRVVVPAKYKGPNAKEDEWAYDGMFAMSVFKAAFWTRRLENCNYPEGRLTESGMKDSPGIDCNFVEDLSPLAPYFGLPLYWNPMLRDAPPQGWDSSMNAEGGPKQVSWKTHVSRKTCEGNKFCSDSNPSTGSPSYSALLQYGYEPNLGAAVDLVLSAGLGWKLTVTGMFHPDLGPGIKFFPFFWIYDYLHLPAAIHMDLSKIQAIPQALNGLHILLLGQCMVSLVGGVACCFCGV